MDVETNEGDATQNAIRIEGLWLGLIICFSLSSSFETNSNEATNWYGY